MPKSRFRTPYRYTSSDGRAGPDQHRMLARDNAVAITCSLMWPIYGLRRWDNSSDSETVAILVEVSAMA